MDPSPETPTTLHGPALPVSQAPHPPLKTYTPAGLVLLGGLLLTAGLANWFRREARALDEARFRQGCQAVGTTPGRTLGALLDSLAPQPGNRLRASRLRTDAGDRPGPTGSIDPGADLRLRPEMLLLDLRLPDGSGIEVCRQAKQLLPQIRVLCLSAFADPAQVMAALAAGAEGYLLKHSDLARIVGAIHRVWDGERVIEPEPAGAGGPAPPRTLPPSERRVMALLVRGLTDKEIAHELGLSPKTVRHTLDRTFRRLGVRSRTQAVVAYLGQASSPAR